MRPRMPQSAPARPTKIFPFHTIGAALRKIPLVESATLLFQRNVPVCASIASRCASSVSRKSVPLSYATPRLVLKTTGDVGVYVDFHSSLQFVASIAYVLFIDVT